ncbi:MAG: RebB family R body protein [Cellvibrionales bacterium]|nr:RebB family R body protein [Cellvibrionales bacterium]
MSQSNGVNGQVTDAVTQTNVNVVAEAPAQAMGSLYQVATHANGIAMQNSVSNQQNLNQMNATIVADAIKIIKGA